MKVNPKLTIALSTFVGAAAGALANDPATAFLSVTTGEHAIVGAGLVGLVALAHWLQDPKPQPVVTELRGTIEHAVDPIGWKDDAGNWHAVAKTVEQVAAKAGPVAVLLIALLFARALVACAAAQDSAYATARASCVSLATSHAQGETCFAQVEQMYCGDGGLLTTSDGGFCNTDGGGTKSP